MATNPKRPRRARATQSKPAGDPRDRVIDALMTLLAGASFGSVALADIAKTAKVSLAELRGLYAGKAAILADFSRRIDQSVLSGGAAEGDRARDRLFDVMMRRFDALAPYKPALKRLARSARCDLGLATTMARITRGSQRWMFAAAGLNPRGIQGAIALQGAAVVFAEAMRVWLTDDDPGLARTKAALDKALQRGDRAMRFVGDLNRMLCSLAEWRPRRPATS